MGIYLGQLPPAEIARFKAELAETIITNFCYPRFFDQRTQALRMRPVDRAKRQEVWLYLSSVDFTQWNRIDLLAPDFQLQIERLFIQFVQRNRAFFGEQGRRRMSDIRLLIGTSAAGVVQGLRSHLTGQKQTKYPFGSPRPVLSWTSTIPNGRSEPGWEQISAGTMTLQQQLQEIRGEVKPTTDSRQPVSRRPASPRSNGEANGAVEPQPVASSPIAAAVQAPTRPAATPVQGGRRVSSPLPSPNIPNTPAATAMPTPAMASAAAPAATPRRPEAPSMPQPERPADIPTPVSPVQPVQPAKAAPIENRKSGALPGESTSVSITSPNIPAQTRNMANGQEGALSNATGPGQSLLGEDLAIFEQLRHQLIVWLRVEAVTAGIEIANLSPAQLLDVLRQQGRQDETRLQVVSSLLNLANQVIKAGSVSLLDYKQALMLHLMHSRR